MSRIKNILIITILNINIVGAQNKFVIKDFLDSYVLEYASINKDNILFEAYALYKDGNRVFINDHFDQLRNATKIKEVSYKDLSGINISLKEDYNFDSKPEICILHPKSENDGSYSPGIYDIYVSHGNNYKYNKSLSSLFNNIFSYRSSDLYVDSLNRRLVTLIGDGCCYHTYEEYEFTSNILTKVAEYTENSSENPIYVEAKGYRIKNQKQQKLEYRYLLDNNNIQEIVKFSTANGKGEVRLFKFENELFYAFMEGEGKIYFAYPPQPNSPKSRFTYNKLENELSFSSGSVIYTIYEYGIRINVKGKITDWKAGEKHQGSLKELGKLNIHNLDK